MKKNGFILSTYVYMILVFFLLILAVTLSIASNNKLLTNKMSESVKEEILLDKETFNLLLKGDSEVEITAGSTYTDPGVIASTTGGTDLTSSVITTSTLNTSTAGVYTITYTLTYSGYTKRVVRKITVK